MVKKDLWEPKHQLIQDLLSVLQTRGWSLELKRETAEVARAAKGKEKVKESEVKEDKKKEVKEVGCTEGIQGESFHSTSAPGDQRRGNERRTEVEQ